MKVRSVKNGAKSMTVARRPVYLLLPTLCSRLGRKTMILVGELINASRKSVGSAIENNDVEAVKKLALDQAENGADYIDANAGVFVGKEADYLKWLVETIQSATNKPCSIDSPDPRAIEAALAVHKGTAMINSISLEKERYDALLPIVAGTDLKVVALCMSDAGMPETAKYCAAAPFSLAIG